MKDIGSSSVVVGSAMNKKYTLDEQNTMMLVKRTRK